MKEEKTEVHGKENGKGLRRKKRFGEMVDKTRMRWKGEIRKRASREAIINVGSPAEKPFIYMIVCVGLRMSSY